MKNIEAKGTTTARYGDSGPANGEDVRTASMNVINWDEDSSRTAFEVVDAIAGKHDAFQNIVDISGCEKDR
jgi:hypothetical protein